MGDNNNNGRNRSISEHVRNANNTKMWQATHRHDLWPPLNQTQSNACLTVNDSWKATKRSKIATDSGINGQSQSQSEPKPPKGRQHTHTHTHTKVGNKMAPGVCMCVCLCCHGSRQMKTPFALRPKIDKETEEQQEGERKGDREKERWQRKFISRCDFSI